MPPQREASSDISMAPPIAFRGDRDFAEEVEHLQPRLDMGSADWETRVLAMQRLEGLVLGAKDAGVSPVVLEGRIKPLIEGLASNLSDGRSRVVRQGCHLIEVLATNMHGGFEACAEILLPDLLKLVPQSIAVIADSAHEATLQIVKNCYPSRLLPRILREIRTSRSAPLRMRCAEYVHHAIVQWGTHHRNPLSGSLMDEIEAFIVASVNDGTREVRAEARQCFRDFGKLWPHREDALRRQFDPAVLKVLAHEDKAMGNSMHSMFQLSTAQDAPRGPSPARPRSPILSRNAVNTQQLVSLQQAAQAMAKRRRQSSSAAMGTVSGPLHVSLPRTKDDTGRSEAPVIPKVSFSGPLVFPVESSRPGAGANGSPQAVAAGPQPQVHLGHMQQAMAQPQQHQKAQPVMIRQLSFNGFRAAAAGPKAGSAAEEPAAVPSRSFWRLGHRGDVSPSNGGAHPAAINSTTIASSSKEEGSPSKSTAPTNRTLQSLFDKVGPDRSGRLEGEGRAGLAVYRGPEDSWSLAAEGEVEPVRRGRGKSLGGDALGMLGFSRTRKLAENLGLEGVSLPGRHGHAVGVPAEEQTVQAAEGRMDLQSIKENLGASAGHAAAPGHALAEAARKVHQGSKGPGKGQGNEGTASAHPGGPLKALFSSNMAPSLGEPGAPAAHRGRAEDHRGGASPLRAFLPTRGTSPLRLWRRESGAGKERKEGSTMAPVAVKETRSRDASPRAGSRRASMASVLEGRRGSSAANSRDNSRESSPTKGRPPLGEGRRAGASLALRPGAGENRVVPTWAMARTTSHSGYDTENDTEGDDMSACPSFKDEGSSQQHRGEKGERQEMGLSQVLHAAKRKEDWEGRVKALTALQQLVLKHSQAGAQPGSTALDLPPPATRAASSRFAADLGRSMEQVLEMVAGSIDFQNHKVAGAALYCLEDIIRNFRDATEGHLDKYLPALFTRAVDPKQPLREQACDLLGLVQESFSREAVLAATERTLERHRVAKAKARAVDFGNEIVQAAALTSVDNVTVKVVRQWGQRLLQLAAEDAKARSEATKGAVLCADIVGITFIVAHFQGMPHATMQELMASIAKASPEVNERVARALKESHGGSRSGPCPWDMSGGGALGPGARDASGQALKHCTSQRDGPPVARHGYGASKSGPIHQERREGWHPGKPGAGGGRPPRETAPGTLGTSSRPARDSMGPQRPAPGAPGGPKAAGVPKACTGAGPAPRAGRVFLGSRSGELGRTQNPTGYAMGSKSGEMPRAGILKSASGDSGMPGSRSSSAARQSAAGAPGDLRMRGAKSQELPAPRRATAGAGAGAGAGARPAGGSARGVSGRRVSRGGPIGFSSRSQPLNASGAPLAELATDSEWSEVEAATDAEEDSNSGRYAGGRRVEGPRKVPRSRSQPLIHGVPAEAGAAEDEGPGQAGGAPPGWADAEGVSELGESTDTESHQVQADDVSASEKEIQLEWEAGQAGRGEENVLPGSFMALLANRVKAQASTPENAAPNPEPAAVQGLLHPRLAPLHLEPMAEPEEAAAGVPVSQATAVQRILGHGSWARGPRGESAVQVEDGKEEGAGGPVVHGMDATAPAQGEGGEEQGEEGEGKGKPGWSEEPLTVQGVQDYAQEVAARGDASDLIAVAFEGGEMEGPTEAPSARGRELEGEALHGLAQGLLEKDVEEGEEGGDGRLAGGVSPEVLRQALSSLECSPKKGLGLAGHLGDRPGLGRGLECSPMKGLVVQIPGDEEEAEGANTEVTGGQGEEGGAAGSGGGEGEEGEEFPWTPVSDLPDTFGSAEKGRLSAQPQLWTGQDAAGKGGLAVAFGTLAVHQEDEGAHALLLPDAETEAQGPEASGISATDRHVAAPSLPERSGGRSGYTGRMVNRELLMMAPGASVPTSGSFPLSQSQGPPLSRGDSVASADMFSCASSLRSPSCGDLTPAQGSLTAPMPAVAVPSSKGKPIPRTQSMGGLQAPLSGGGQSLHSLLFVGTPPSETDMGSCLISPSGELHPELVRAAAEAATAGGEPGGEEASEGFSLPGNITPDQLKSPRDILAAAAMILQASQQLQQHQMQMQMEADGVPEQDGALDGQGQGQAGAATGMTLPSGRFASVPMLLWNPGGFEREGEPGSGATVGSEMDIGEEPVPVQGQAVATSGTPRAAPKLRRASSGRLHREEKGDRSQPSTTPLGRSSSSSRNAREAEEEGAAGSPLAPSPVLPSRFSPSPLLAARQPEAGGPRRSSSGFRLPHSQSFSSGMGDLGGLSGSASVTPSGRMSRSASEERGPLDEDIVKYLANQITDYYIGLELDGKLDKNEEHDDRTSLARINVVLENIIVQ